MKAQIGIQNWLRFIYEKFIFDLGFDGWVGVHLADKDMWEEVNSGKQKTALECGD